MIPYLVVFLNVIPCHNFVTMPLEENLQEDSSYSLRNCISREGGNFGNTLGCLKEGALDRLTNADGSECVDLLDGVSLLREDNEAPLPRGLHPASLLDAASEFVGRRYLKWDMSAVQPGLYMKVGPMLDKSGHLEFAMEDGYQRYPVRTVSTGKNKKKIF